MVTQMSSVAPNDTLVNIKKSDLILIDQSNLSIQKIVILNSLFF